MKGVPSGVSLYESHTWMVQSYEPEMMRVSSGEKETEVTPAVWPLNGLPTEVPLGTLQTLIVQSLDPETMLAPSGEKATQLTNSV